MAGRLRVALLGLCGALVVTALAVLARGCPGETEAHGELRARRDVLQREVAGLRELASGGPALPPGDVAIAIDDTLVRDLIGAQLPFQADLGRFHVTLRRVGVEFRGRPLVSLHGSACLREEPRVAAALEVRGALEQVRVDATQGRLQARMALDEVTIENAAGRESVLGDPALHALEHTLRRQLESLLPAVQIPVQFRQQLQLPAVSSGPVRIAPATLMLQVAVSRVLAGGGRLWIAVSVRAGQVQRAGVPAAERRP
ncbi:MAG TPA: hypothetical protein VMX54_07745 [Vicinamibacteria bacterium]|nr:hypothetical protein [Vicinamibacteria bacterium]